MGALRKWRGKEAPQVRAAVRNIAPCRDEIRRPAGGAAAFPRRGDGNEQRNALRLHRHGVTLDEPTNDETAHAVRNDRQAAELKSKPQLRQGLFEMLCQQGQSQAGRIVVDPGLKSCRVEVRGEIGEIARRSAIAMHEQNGHPVRIVRLEEIDSGSRSGHEPARTPHPVAGGAGTEMFFIERRHDTVPCACEQRMDHHSLVVAVANPAGAAGRQAQEGSRAQKRQAAVSHSASDLSSFEMSMYSYSSLVAT